MACQHCVWTGVYGFRHKNMRIALLLLFILIAPTMQVNACDLVIECVETLPDIAEPGAGLNTKKQAFSEKLQAFGAEAIPVLLPYLKNDNLDAVSLASYALKGLDGLSEEHLGALIEGYHNGGVRLPSDLSLKFKNG
jgi:hypothetical protein